GYQVFQLADPTVKAGELWDITKAQIVFQCDIKNGVKDIKNFMYHADVGTEVAEGKVTGSDEGIKHSFIITEDKFALGSSTDLVNYKKYYYMAVAYAYNSYAPYHTDDAEGLIGQKNPYLAGNKNVKMYTVIPHKNAIEEGGTVALANYGDKPQIIQYEGQGNGGNAVLLSKKTIDEILANGKADSLIFEKNAGPVEISVVDPLMVKDNDYTLRFCNKDGSLADEVSDDTYWCLEYKTENGTDTVIFSETNVNVPNEQLLLDLGISIFVKNAKFTVLDENIRSENETGYKLLSSVSFLTSSVSYQKVGSNWYQGYPDQEVNGPQNWIRAGQTRDGDWTLGTQSWEQIRREDFYIKLNTKDITLVYDTSKGKQTIWLDRGKQFDKIENAFAPYALASYYDGNPAYGYIVYEGPKDSAQRDNDQQGGGNPARRVYPCMTELYSVDIVLTADTMLWTRCPVVELCNDTLMSVGRAIRHNLRRSPSVFRNGKPDNSGMGMGWFPGYAICVETGERLNMMFGENSLYGKYNGADMLFNPTAEEFGMHFLYVFGHRDLYEDDNVDANKVINTPADSICPPYGGRGDGNGGEWVYRKLLAAENMPGGTIDNRIRKSIAKNYVYKNAMWTGISLAHYQYEWLEKGNDVTIRIRVSRPYSRWTSTTGTGKGADAVNNDMPLYKFSTKDLATLTNRKPVVATQMDSIYITPNPYYGIATGGYEASQVDTRVKIINLPQRCSIKIYTLNGTLIRQHNFESPSRDSKNPNAITYWEWDLKNSANIPIASGMYLIHVQEMYGDPGGRVMYGTEKTLKFLCIQRPIDVNAF
ncbi:MAG: hypothetical protein FWH36_09475, partial [Lentimicrobiaceae bacterium]|nr:hypothetical protein [Lentimicrobiaceae bacterium]